MHHKILDYIPKLKLRLALYHALITSVFNVIQFISGYSRFQRLLQKLRQLFEHKTNNDNNGRIGNNGGYVITADAGP